MKAKVKDPRVVHYRNKALLVGGGIGAAFGVVIGAIAGVSLEAAFTGFVGGWLLGEIITLGSTPTE